jgi:hypothetical protein
MRPSTRRRPARVPFNSPACRPYDLAVHGGVPSPHEHVITLRDQAHHRTATHEYLNSTDAVTVTEPCSFVLVVERGRMLDARGHPICSITRRSPSALDRHFCVRYPSRSGWGDDHSGLPDMRRLYGCRIRCVVARRSWVAKRLPALFAAWIGSSLCAVIEGSSVWLTGTRFR